MSLPTGANANPAFGVGTSGTWANIPGRPDRRHQPCRRAPLPLRGRQPATTRTRACCTCARPGGSATSRASVVADLKQDGFIDYLWFTNYETADPAYSANSAADARPTASKYAYGQPARADDTHAAPDDPVPRRRRLRRPGAQQRPHADLRGDVREGVTSSSTHDPDLAATARGCAQPEVQGRRGPVYAAPIADAADQHRDEEGDAQRPAGRRPASRLPVHGPDDDHVRDRRRRAQDARALAVDQVHQRRAPPNGRRDQPAPSAAPRHRANGSSAAPTAPCSPVLERNLDLRAGRPGRRRRRRRTPRASRAAADFTCTSATTVKVKARDGNKLTTSPCPRAGRSRTARPSNAQYPYVTATAPRRCPGPGRGRLDLQALRLPRRRRLHQGHARAAR